MSKLSRWIRIATGTTALGAIWAGAAPVAPALVLNVDRTVMLRDGKPTPIVPVKDLFGPGADGVNLSGGSPIFAQLQWKLTNVPEGDYDVGLAVSGMGYMGFSENFPAYVFCNNTRLDWRGYTDPVRPETATDPHAYQTEMRLAGPVHLKPGDVLRAANGWGTVTLGPLRLYATPPGGDEVPIYTWRYPNVQPAAWLNAEWNATQRDGEFMPDTLTGARD